MTRKRNQHPVAEVATPDEDQIDSMAAIGAAIEQKRSEAEAARDLEGVKARKAAERRAAGQTEINRISQETTVAAAGLDAESRTAGYLAETLEGDVRGLAVAQREQAQGDEANRIAAALSTERSQLLAQIAELCDTAERIQGEMQEIDAQLAAARGSANADLVASLRVKLTGREDVAADTASKLKEARERSRQIGDGTANFAGELLDALRESERHHAVARKILNDVDPDRPEAVADRLVEDIRGGLAALGEQLANPSKPQAQRRVVRL